jgi:hypothetical protein
MLALTQEEYLILRSLEEVFIRRFLLMPTYIAIATIYARVTQTEYKVNCSCEHKTWDDRILTLRKLCLDYEIQNNLEKNYSFS